MIKKSLIFIFAMFGVVIGLTNNVKAQTQDYLDGYNAGLSEGYNEGYGDGYNDGLVSNDGYIAGYTDGLNEGANHGYGLGYTDGYDEGYGEGINDNIETGGFGLLLASAFSAIGVLLSIQLLPNITIGALVAIPVVFGVVMFILGRRKE